VRGSDKNASGWLLLFVVEPVDWAYLTRLTEVIKWWPFAFNARRQWLY